MNGLGQRLRTRSVGFFLAAVFLILIGALLRNYFFASGEIQYYVSPEGNDANLGTFEAPFQTIAKAQAVLRGTSPAGGATVFLRGGRYQISQTLEFIATDSGRDGYPIRYAAYQGEKPIIDGTIDLPAPVLASGSEIGSLPAGKIYKVDMSQVTGADFRTSGITNLTRNGQIQTLARYPNYKTPNFGAVDPWIGQFVFATSDTPLVRNQIKYNPGQLNPAGWSNVGSGARAVIFSGPNYWDSTVDITTVNTTGSLLNLAGSTSYDILPNNRFYVENVKELLDSHGEWFYDKQTNNTYFYFDSVPASSDVFSVVRTGNLINITDTTNLVIEDMIIRGSSGAAIYIRGTRTKNIAVNRNEIFLTNREGVKAEGTVEAITVDGNTIHDVGWQGISIVQSPVAFKSLSSMNHAISNNTIFRVGNKWRANSGIEVFSVGALISHNEIYDTPRMGIIFRGNDNIVEFNRIYRTNLETQDAGGIYMYGRSWLTRGNVVRNNYVREVGGYGLKTGAWSFPFYSFGIYLDDFASDNAVLNNVVVGAGQAGLLIHGGRDNRVENNFFIDSRTDDTVAMIGQKMSTSHVPLMWTELSTMEQNGYDRAKYFEKYPNLATISETMTDEQLFANNRLTKNVLSNVNGAQQYSINTRRFLQAPNTVSDYNVFWSNKTYNILDSYLSTTYSFATWQAKGIDVHSVFADPIFDSSTSRENFSFAAGSPATTLGISPIDVSTTGPLRQQVTTPIVTIVAPKSNQAFSGVAEFSAAASDVTALRTVTFKIDGVDVATFGPVLSYQKKIDLTPYADGLHTFTVVAVNVEGGLGSASVSFTTNKITDTQPPSVTLNSPAADSRITRTTKLIATAADNTAVTKVEFYLDNQLLKSLSTVPYSFSWNPRKASKGEHTIFVKAYDAAGNVGTSPTVTIVR